MVVDFGHPMQQHGVGMGMGVGGVQPVDVRQEDQKVRVNALRHDGGQGVVVADDDFVGGDGVVLVDDGQGVQLQQPVQGVGKVLPPGLVGGVVPGNQQLGYGVVVVTEQLVVCIHQLALSHGSGGLLRGDVLWPLPQPQLSHAHADGTGGNQNHFVTGIFDVAHDFAQQLHPADVQVPGGVRQSGGADFNNDAHISLPQNEFGTLYSFSRIK